MRVSCFRLSGMTKKLVQRWTTERGEESITQIAIFHSVLGVRLGLSTVPNDCAPVAMMYWCAPVRRPLFED